MKVAVVFAFATAAADQVHPDRKAQIKEINDMPGVLWTAKAQDRFAHERPGASASLNGVLPGGHEIINKMVDEGAIVRLNSQTLLKSVSIPEAFDSATNWPHCAKVINDIRDQSNCGCCWAFAGAEAASDRMCIATNATMMYSLSAQDTCFNGGGLYSSGCDGGAIQSPWTFMKKYAGYGGGKGAVSGGGYQGTEAFGKGLCSDFTMPHCHHHGPKGTDPYPAEGEAGCPAQTTPDGPKACDSTAKAPHNSFKADKHLYNGATITTGAIQGGSAESIQQALMAGGPMETAFDVYTDFENYATGIYHHVSGDKAGGHAVKIVGWGVENGNKYWKIANSWNPYWGEQGFFRMLRGTNECGIEDQVMASAPDAVWERAGEAEVVV